jgi:hypothetical protein
MLPYSLFFSLCWALRHIKFGDKNNNMKNYILVDPAETSLISEIELLPPKKKEKEDEKNTKAGGSKPQQQSTGIPGAGDAAPPTAAPPEAKPAETEPDSEAEKKQKEGENIPPQVREAIELFENIAADPDTPDFFKEEAGLYVKILKGESVYNLATGQTDPELKPKDGRSLGGAIGTGISLKVIDAITGIDPTKLTTFEGWYSSGLADLINVNADFFGDKGADEEESELYGIATALSAVAMVVIRDTNLRRRQTLYDAFGEESSWGRSDKTVMSAEKIYEMLKSEQADVGVGRYDPRRQSQPGSKGKTLTNRINTFDPAAKTEAIKVIEQEMAGSRTPVRRALGWETVDIDGKKPGFFKNLGNVATRYAVKQLGGPARFLSALLVEPIRSWNLTSQEYAYVQTFMNKLRSDTGLNQVQLANIDKYITNKAKDTKSVGPKRRVILDMILDQEKFAEAIGISVEDLKKSYLKELEKLRNNMAGAVKKADEGFITNIKKGQIKAAAAAAIPSSIVEFFNKAPKDIAKEIDSAEDARARVLGQAADEFAAEGARTRISKGAGGSGGGLTRISKGSPGPEGGRTKIDSPDRTRYIPQSQLMNNAARVHQAAQAKIKRLQQPSKVIKKVTKESKEVDFESLQSQDPVYKQYLEDTKKLEDAFGNNPQNIKNYDIAVQRLFDEQLKQEEQETLSAANEVLNDYIDQAAAQYEAEFQKDYRALDSIQKQATLPEPTQTKVDVDGSDDPIDIKGKVPPQAPVNENKIRISKDKLIRLISEQVKEYTQTVDVTKDQLVALVAQEAFKQINRKK